MTPALYILIGILGGAFVAGMVFIVLAFLKYAREMKASLDQLRIVLTSISKDGTLAESLSSFRDMVNVGKSLGVKVDKVTTVIDLFYRVALKADQAIAAGQAAVPAPEVEPGASAIYAYDEEAQGRAEVQRKLRTAGVNIPADKEIPAGQATGAQV
jgi:hypothetical protein